jgi:ribonuclease M5
MKPRVREVIVVEGRYDKNTLLQAVDAAVIETGGFAVFNDREKTAYLRRLAQTRGLILLTDPDGAGFVIRDYLKGVLPPDRLKQAYVPDVYGRERRKKKGGKEGKLGVEGMSPAVLVEVLRRAGATFEDGPAAPRRTGLTKADLLEKGLIGPGSAARRAALQQRLGLPARLTANGLLEALDLLLTRAEFDAL